MTVLLDALVCLLNVCMIVSLVAAVIVSLLALLEFWQVRYIRNRRDPDYTRTPGRDLAGKLAPAWCSFAFFSICFVVASHI